MGTTKQTHNPAKPHGGVSLADDVDQVDDDGAGASEDEQEPIDLLSLLTIDELNSGSRILKASITIALTQRTEEYERATAVLAYLHARKVDPSVKVTPYFAKTFTEVQDELSDVVDRVRQETDPLAPTPSP